MDVGQYIYFQKYLKQLIIYYNQNVKEMNIKNRFGICKEIENLEKMLNYDNK